MTERNEKLQTKKNDFLNLREGENIAKCVIHIAQVKEEKEREEEEKKKTQQKKKKKKKKK